MVESVQGQIFVISPFLNDVSVNSLMKKDKIILGKLDESFKALEAFDITPSIDLIITLLTSEYRDIYQSCLSTLNELFSSKEFEFFLSSNHSISLIDIFLDFLEKPKGNVFADASSCLTSFLISPNQQFYIHNEILSGFVERMLKIIEENCMHELKNVVESVIRRFCRKIVLLLEKSSKDKLLLSDYVNISKLLIKSLSPSKVNVYNSFLLSMIQVLVFSTQSFISATNECREICLIEVPQMFIQCSFIMSKEVYSEILDLFKMYVSFEDFVIPSLPTIIDELITPSFELSLVHMQRALSYLEAICSMKKPSLLIVFAMFDCNASASTRVFEKLMNSITQCILTNNENTDKCFICFQSLLLVLFTFQTFYLTAESSTLTTESIDERTILDQKMNIEGCAKLFNDNPKKGLQMMLKSELVTDSPQSIGKFIRECSLLDSSKVSEFLGKAENADILNHYIKTYNFQKKSIDEGLRELCSTFLLPGESQQIDRVMLGFASKYHEDNPEISEDAAYVLSFSVIMLQTDIHNPNVTRKITCEQWVTNTRHVKEAREVDISVLQGIYNRVAAKPMQLNTIYSSNLMKNNSRHLLESIIQKEEYLVIPSIKNDLLVLIVDRHWPNFFATISNIVQTSFDSALIDIAFQCASTLVFFSSNFLMEKALDTIVSFWCQFCLSTPKGEIADISIKSLILTIRTNGDNLGRSWLPVLQFFSSLLSSAEIEMEAIDARKPQEAYQSVNKTFMVDIDEIYANSNILSGFAFLSFIRSLCDVSTEELCMNPPKLFSMQKIIEVMSINFGRVRFIWSQAWAMVHGHFNRTGCLDHEDISMFSLNGLRQIISSVICDVNRWKIVQSELLLPYVIVFQNQTLDEPRLFVLASIGSFLDRLYFDESIESLLDIIETSLSDNSKNILSSSFKLYQNFIDNIPERLTFRSISLLVGFVNQMVLQSIRVQSMELLVSKTLMVKHVTKGLISTIVPTMSVIEKELLVYSVGLFFSLARKLSKTEDLKEILENVFQSSSKTQMIELIQHFYMSFLESNDKYADLIPFIASEVIRTNDRTLTNQFIIETIRFSQKKGKIIQVYCINSISSIIESPIFQQEMLSSIINQCKYQTISILLMKHVCLKACENSFLRIISDSLSIALNYEDHDSAKSLMIYHALSTVKLNSSKEAVQIVEIVASFIKSHNDIHLHCPKSEFINLFIEFLSNESSNIRNFVKSIAQSFTL